MDWTTQRHLLQLPDEVLGHIVSYLPLLQLAHVRLVCSRLHYLIDRSSLSHSLWREASLENTWPSMGCLAVIERGAKHGNLEALIKLAIAYLYSQGVPDGPGKGTIHAFNGLKAAHYLERAEALINRQPFSWVLIRPPFASSCVCCKASVCHNIKRHCTSALPEDLVHGLFYVVGKAMSHYESFVEERHQACQWFNQGAKHGCPYSSFEIWKEQRHLQDEVQAVRELRKIVGKSNTCIDAQFELGKLYAKGQYGGSSKTIAYQYIHEQIVKTAPTVLSSAILDVQPDITMDMIFILLDWLVEVSDTKDFSTQTIHLAINLVQRYIMVRKLKRTRLQLLGVTALLLAARWTAVSIITIREAAWLTDNTYGYDEVVCMMGDIVGALHGDIQRPIITDYLELFQILANVDQKTSYLSFYISEMAVLFPAFGKFTVAHVAASCILLARILLNKELPWSSTMVEATGYTVHHLYECALLLYVKCLTDESSVLDYRGVELCAVRTRYEDERFMSVSQIEYMPYNTLKERLGLIPSRRLAASRLKNNKSSTLIVTQSFVDEFDAQTLSESNSPLPQILSVSNSPLPQTLSASSSPQPQNLSKSNSPLPQTLSPHCYYSPKASFDSPSLIVFNTSSSSSSSSSLDDSLDGLSSLHSYRSSSVPLLPLTGIEQLEETENNQNIPPHSSYLRNNSHTNKITLPDNTCTSNGKLPITNSQCFSKKPLGSLTNYCLRPATVSGHRTIMSEKRTLSSSCTDNSSQLIRNKRHRSTNNLL